MEDILSFDGNQILVIFCSHKHLITQKWHNFWTSKYWHLLLSNTSMNVKFSYMIAEMYWGKACRFSFSDFAIFTWFATTYLKENWYTLRGDNYDSAGLDDSVGCAVRLETRRSRVQPPPRSATFFRGDWSWNIFYGHSLPSADSRRAVVSFWRKNVHNTG